MNKDNYYQLGITEQKLQDFILSQYKSLREFCMQIDRPYSTIVNMLKRGLLNSSVDLVLYVVDRLGLDIDELFNGHITLKTDTSLNPEITKRELSLIRAYREKPEMQAAVDRLLGIKAAEPGIRVYRAAQSDNNHEDEIITISAERLQRLKDAPETDEDL